MRDLTGFSATILFSCLLTACGGIDRSDAGELVVERSTVGDTLVVRTVSGSTWGADAHLVPEMSIGEMEGDLEYLLGRVASLGVASDGTVYVVDAQIPELRAYSADGVYVATLGSAGEGPGELNQPDGGLAVLSDGRVLVRDPGNARLQVFTADGEPGESWGVVRGGFNTSSPLWWDREDNVYIGVLLDPEADLSDWRMGIARIRPDGTPADTLEPPDTGYEAPFLEARSENSVSRNGVPFSPNEQWAFHPGGYFLHGVSTRYAITLAKRNGPLRIERAYDPVPVQSAEREAREAEMTRNMRSMKPDWRWNGPAIPEDKPPFRDLYAARDGRIWVQVYQGGRETENFDYDPQDEGSRPTKWQDPIVFDVFGEDGTYFGRVSAPEGFSTYPTPIFDTDYVWAVTRDEFDVSRVVRFRIAVEGPAQ